jgi:N-methylhydantoinase A
VSTPSLRIGIDIGGTFTDFVIHNPQTGNLKTFKLPTTPSDPAKAVLDGLKELAGSYRIIHGSTVATNALLERKGTRTALVTTRGFRDVLQIGRQNRPALYDLYMDPPAPLVPRDFRFELNERVSSDGRILRALSQTEIDMVAQTLQGLDLESVAVCLLFSFLVPEHEQQVADALRKAGLNVSVSHEILPEYREYERTSTTVVNAYVTPVIDKYIQHLEQALVTSDASVHPQRTVDLRMMQSNGGSISTAEARRNGVRCIVSGPAGGVVGALHLARLATGKNDVNIITFDMGGT